MLAEKVFRKKRLDEDHLTAAGFSRDGQLWILSKELMPGLFRAELRAHPESGMTGRVIDLESGDDYLPLEVECAVGKFTGMVRDAYRRWLEETAARFEDLPFESPQANRLAAWASGFFSVPLEQTFRKAEGSVLRHPHNGRWFSVFLKVKASALQKAKDEKPAEKADRTGNAGKRPLDDMMAEIMNLKIDPSNLDDLLQTPGIYLCWHMNKKHWISLSLNDALSDQRIMALMKQSFALVGRTSGSVVRRASPNIQSSAACSIETPAAWVIPSNPAHYNVAEGFSNSPDATILWHQRIHARPGDQVFIYQAAPIAAIIFRCEAIETDLPADDPALFGMHPASAPPAMMRLKLLTTYPKDRWPRAFLNQHGIKVTVRGQRSMPSELFSIMEAYDQEKQNRP